MISHESEPTKREESTGVASEGYLSAEKIIAFEDTSGNRRNLLAKTDVLPVLTATVQGMNRFGMGGIGIRKAENQEGATEDLRRFEVSAVYPYSLDFLTGEMIAATGIYIKSKTGSLSRDNALDAARAYLDPKSMKERYGKFHEENKHQIMSKLFPDSGN